MTDEHSTLQTGAENVTWDLRDLYVSADDPSIEQDITQTELQAAAFSEAYHDNVAALGVEELFEAIAEYENIVEQSSKIGAFVHLQWSTDTGYPRYGALLQRVTEWSAQLQQRLVFFELELVNYNVPQKLDTKIGE